MAGWSVAERPKLPRLASTLLTDIKNSLAG